MSGVVLEELARRGERARRDVSGVEPCQQLVARRAQIGREIDRAPPLLLGDVRRQWFDKLIKRGRRELLAPVASSKRTLFNGSCLPSKASVIARKCTVTSKSLGGGAPSEQTGWIPAQSGFSLPPRIEHVTDRGGLKARVVQLRHAPGVSELALRCPRELAPRTAPLDEFD